MVCNILTTGKMNDKKQARSIIVRIHWRQNSLTVAIYNDFFEAVYKSSLFLLKAQLLIKQFNSEWIISFLFCSASHFNVVIVGLGSYKISK